MRIHVFGLLMNWDRAAKGDGGWSQLYRAAIQRVAPGAEVTFDTAPFGQGGSFYEAYARTHPLVRPAGVDCLVVVSWSAGYGAVRTWGRDGLLECDVLATLDSGYATTGADGRPLPAHVEPWTRIARAAIAGGMVWVSGASDVPTHPGPDATLPTAPGYASYGGYESTRELMAAVAESVHLEMETLRPTFDARVVAEATAGSLLLRFYDGVAGDRGTAEHIAAVRPTDGVSSWGPDLVAEGVHMWALGRASCPATSSPTTESPAPALREGARGPDVMRVQRIVAVAQDGVWGPLTTHAVLAWRAAHGLPSGAWWDEQCQAVADSEPQLYHVRGADVSRAQGEGAANEWDRWGVEFGFARSSSGVTVDPTFAGNWHAMTSQVRGAYHYVNGRPVDDQLDAIMRAMLPFTHPEDMPVALDIEPWDPQSRVTPDWIAAMASGIPVELARRLRELGCNVGIYTGAWAIDSVPGLTAALLALDPWWWIADGSGAAIAAGCPTHLPRGVPIERVLFWQRGRFAAVGEPLPIDEDRFRGSLDALRAFARG